ncbi:MAG: hypothetical protein ACOY32_01805 [Thermodesulfobacteriota bacterium]
MDDEFARLRRSGEEVAEHRVKFSLLRQMVATAVVLLTVRCFF